MEINFYLNRSVNSVPEEDEDEDVDDDEDDDSRPATPKRSPSVNAMLDEPGVRKAEEGNITPAAALQIPAYPPPPTSSSLLAASMGGAGLNSSVGPLAYPRPIHPALMLEAMNFHQRMMPTVDGRPSPYASFMAGHPLMPRLEIKSTRRRHL